jgi:hypothetical protein
MAKFSRYRTEIVAGLMVTVVLLSIGSLVGHGILRSEQEAYERGARAAIIHSRCRGTFPSIPYIQRAFRWGETNSCDDVQEVDGTKPRG